MKRDTIQRLLSGVEAAGAKPVSDTNDPEALKQRVNTTHQQFLEYEKQRNMKKVGGRSSKFRLLRASYAPRCILCYSLVMILRKFRGMEPSRRLRNLIIRTFV